jgi:type VI secretion system protein ImpC
MPDPIRELLECCASRFGIVGPDVEATLQFWRARIDQLLSEQLRLILHHPAFQALEATWRGLQYLVQQTRTGPDMQIRVLNVCKEDLAEDLDAAVEESDLFGKVYREAYETPCGLPFSLLVGDYAFSHAAPDVALLRALSEIAAESFAPFVAAAAPAMFGIRQFQDLNHLSLSAIFQRPEYTAWKAFRDTEEARFAALTLPRVLARRPYGVTGVQVQAFAFEECVGNWDSDYLWMSAAWAYADRIMAAHAQDGWPARIRGVEGGGKVEGLPIHWVATEDEETFQGPAEITIDDRHEFELSVLGFLPLVGVHHRDFAVFLGASSCAKPKRYADEGAQWSSEMSTRLNNLLCAAQFCHPLKLMARDWGTDDEAHLQWSLNAWIRTYIVSDPESASLQQKIERPLGDAQIEIREDPDRSGRFRLILHLRPTYQTEMRAALRFLTSVPQIGYRPSPLEPGWKAWNEGLVPKLARMIQDERRYTDLPILADALEEAGCTSANILEHCRAGEEHWCGCWVVDAILEQP